ncbi:unnamed protein product, partial [Discosporangium mesarthrocarpum]
GVFAIGDAAVEKDHPLGPLAQVANQQGKASTFRCDYLAKCFSRHSDGRSLLSNDAVPPFRYRHLGSMAQVGEWRALVDLKAGSLRKPGGGGPIFSGFLAFVTWRSAYWTKTVRCA